MLAGFQLPSLPFTFSFYSCFLQFLVDWLSEVTNISSEFANSEERTTDIHEKK